MDKSDNNVYFNDVITEMFNSKEYDMNKTVIVFVSHYIRTESGTRLLGDKSDPLCILYENKVAWQNTQCFKEAPLDFRYFSESESYSEIQTYSGQEIADNLFTEGGG